MVYSRNKRAIKQFSKRLERDRGCWVVHQGPGILLTKCHEDWGNYIKLLYAKIRAYVQLM